MKKRNEVTEGQKYGKLTIIKEVSPIGSKRRILCKCDCGNIKEYSMDRVIHGRTQSCGCLRKEMFLTHRNDKGTSAYPKEATTSKLYKIWNSMKCRCYTISSGAYFKYGAKGIKMCDEWKNDFMTFYNWAIANGYSDGLTIDRIDYRGNYEPSNCRWADMRTQANNKSNVRKYEYNGKLHTMTEWSEIMNINYGALWERLNVLGWSIEKALTTPVRDDGKHKKAQKGG